MQPYELSFAERRDWLRLVRTPGIGPVAFWRLMLRYGSAEEALANLPRTLRGQPLLPVAAEQAEAEMDASEALGVRMLFASDPDYPDLLRQLDPVPPLLSAWGEMSLTSRPCVAIVGSRNASAIGLKFAGQIAGELGAAGVTVVSGLARGIDASAHRASLETGTIGVLGGGVDHIYPRQNTELHLAMRERGLLISESPLGYRASAKDFPRRNRLISGLCQGVVVVEAAERSGTLITARYALEQNREVMAAPGSPLDPRTKGCNRLIRDGATLIETTEDILAVIGTTSKAQASSPQTETRPISVEIDTQPAQLDLLLDKASGTPTHRDDLIRESGLSAADAAAALLELELSGQIAVESDGRISRT